MRRPLLTAGIAAPLVYLAAVVVASGLAGALGIRTSFAGLLERVTIGGFVL